MPVRYRMKYDGVLWGAGTDYWTALEMGLVPAPEQRAMTLLQNLCDEERVGIYCETGGLPAMGNITGNMYIINRRFGVDEMVDGRIVANYCIALVDEGLPRTDNVIAIMTRIEGEEMSFLRTGNRFSRKWGTSRPRTYNPFVVPFMPTEDIVEVKKFLRRADHTDIDEPPKKGETPLLSEAAKRRLMGFTDPYYGAF